MPGSNSQSPLAVRSEQAIESAGTAGMTVSGRQDVERFEAKVVLPPSFQYKIAARTKVDGQWVDNSKVAPTSDGYDYLNRVLGASFFVPDRVPDQEGNFVPNPIRRPDYIYLRAGAVWYNEVGQLVCAMEDLEVDFAAIYHNARLSQPGAEIVMDTETGMPDFGKNGYPKVVISDHQKMWDNKPSGQPVTAAAQEKKAVEALMQLRTHGMRYAQTVVRTRLLKVAIGIKSLPIHEPQPFAVKIVGFKDRMTPMERIEAAQQSSQALFGAPIRPGLTEVALDHETMSTIEPDDVDTSVDRTVGLAASPDEGSQDPDDRQMPGENIAPKDPSDEFNFGG